MKTKFLIGAFAFLMALGFAACDDSSSANNNSGTQTTTQPGNGGNGGNSDNSLPVDVCGAKPEPVCNFKKEDKVWKFIYKEWNYIDIYTWVDDSTIEFKECMNVTHMDRNDSTYTNVTRDEMFKKVMEECQSRADVDGGK